MNPEIPKRRPSLSFEDDPRTAGRPPGKRNCYLTVWLPWWMRNELQEQVERYVEGCPKLSDVAVVHRVISTGTQDLESLGFEDWPGEDWLTYHEEDVS